MSVSTDCQAHTIRGVMMCVTHNVPLVERKVLESQGIVLEQTALDGLFCPVSHSMFRKQTADHLLDQNDNG